MDVKTFETERLFLKAISLEDVPAYEKHFIDYEVVQHLSSAVPWPYPEGGVEWFLRNIILPQQGLDRWTWGIYLKENPPELIGCVDLWREAKPENRGFWLGRKFWGQGYMTEAVRPVMDYAFDELGFERLILTNALGNQKSRRVKEKTGAKLIDVRPASFVRLDYSQTEVWEIAKEDWRKFNQ